MSIVKIDATKADVLAKAKTRAAVDEQLKALDVGAGRALRELLLDQLNVKSLSGAQRAAARARLKQLDDDADALRATRP